MNDELLMEETWDGEAPSWTRLIDDHDEIARRCQTLLALVGGADPEPEHAAVLLLRLSILVTDHLGVEDHILDMTAAAMAAGHSAGETRAMKDVLDGLKRDWTVYLACWSPRAIAGKWDAFTAETRAMMPRLATQVAQENDILYAPAVRHGTLAVGAVRLH